MPGVTVTSAAASWSSESGAASRTRFAEGRAPPPCKTMPAAPREKRRTQRIQPFVCPCTLIEGDKRLRAYLTDLSVQGARVSCDAPLPAGAQAVVLEVRFKSRGPSTRLHGRIQWRSPGTKHGEAAVFGVTFDEAAADERAVLEAVVDQFRQRAALLA